MDIVVEPEAHGFADAGMGNLRNEEAAEDELEDPAPFELEVDEVVVGVRAYKVFHCKYFS